MVLSYFEIWTGIDRLAESLGLSPSGLAVRAGLDPNAFTVVFEQMRKQKVDCSEPGSFAKINTILINEMNARGMPCCES